MVVAHSPRKGAFTLIEILVVLVIIAILSALLFPAFARARENGRQATCSSNLQQLYIATQQYFQDERAYPDSIVDLLPANADQAGNNTLPTTNSLYRKVPDSAVGYFKAGSSSLTCPNDNSKVVDATLPRSSYGILDKARRLITQSAQNVTPPLPYTATNAKTATTDLGTYMWNYWGYSNGGYAYVNADEAALATSGNAIDAYRLVDGNNVGPASKYQSLRFNQTGAWPIFNAETLTTTLDSETVTGYNASKRDDTIAFSLSNRFAPPSTIITHCVFHRPNTDSGNVEYPGQLYSTDANVKFLGARDVVLRLDGTVKVVDVSQWFGDGKTTNHWINQNLTQ